MIIIGDVVGENMIGVILMEVREELSSVMISRNPE
jgi:predicted NAD-dependent protein-ADP-ribosyltransferase YbiA (DUF1768 family)